MGLKGCTMHSNGSIDRIWWLAWVIVELLFILDLKVYDSFKLIVVCVNLKYKYIFFPDYFN